jgi:hypothetical protein
MRRGHAILAVTALVMTVVALPIVAEGSDEPLGDCPKKWEITAVDAVDESVSDKAASKDAKGNGDGLVCQKLNKAGKFQVKDNSRPLKPETTEPADGTACPAGSWVLTQLDDVDFSVTEKAASKDAKGNGDGQVCQKQNKKGKFQVKDNNTSVSTEG